MAILAHAFLSVMAATEPAPENGSGLVRLTRHEIRRLLAAALQPIHDVTHGRWSTRSCGNCGQDQNLRKSGRPSCHNTSTTWPMMLDPLIGPQYRLSHEIVRLSPSM
jgi:hypothetical protein